KNALQGYTPALNSHFERFETFGLNKVFIADRALGNGATLQHEFGHFFTLQHTYGNSPVEGTTDELPDGSNCLTAGDFICDTPPDPNGQLDCCTCEYIGTINPSHIVFDPLVNNFMSYYKYCCKNAFTPGQLAAMRKAAILYRNYLK
ncbi:MAG: M43 family zinc metalloprotease, partial [Bacteroidota bacterium]